MSEPNAPADPSGLCGEASDEEVSVVRRLPLCSMLRSLSRTAVDASRGTILTTKALPKGGTETKRKRRLTAPGLRRLPLCSMLRNNVSGREAGLPGRISAGF